MIDFNKLKLPPKTEKRGKRSFRFRCQIKDVGGMPKNIKKLIKIPETIETNKDAQHFLEEEYSKFIYECSKDYNPNCEYKFKDFLDIFMKYHESGIVDSKTELDSRPRTLSIRTFQSYKDMMPRVVAALGEMKLKNIKTRHIDSFIVQLSQCGVRDDCKFKSKEILKDLLKNSNKTNACIVEEMGIGYQALLSILKGKNVSLKTANKVSDYFVKEIDLLFEKIELRKTLSPKTINNYLAFLSSVFSQAMRWEYIEKNPCANCKKLEVIQELKPALEESSINEFFRCVNQFEDIEFKLQVSILALTGCRRGEMIALTWDDLDLTSGTMTIRKSILYDREYKTYISTTKTNRIRGFTISKELVELFSEYKTIKANEFEKRNMPFLETGNVFTNKEGGLLNPDTFSCKLYRFKNTHGFKDVNINSLLFRHNFITRLVESGVSVYEVSAQAGHTNINTTLRHYKDATPIDKEKQLSERMGSIIKINS